MTNVLYQTAVEELEAVLSPRVVSRSLKEGLRQHGRSPDTLDVPTLEQILKAQVYRQLQVTMPVTEAKSTVAGIITRLKESGGDAESAAGAEGHPERVAELQRALKPYNLYFEWPEVQKLRAQLQLLESELDSGRTAGPLLADAEAQLELVAQKLEDLLVLQAREVAELQEALEQVREVGGAKVKRLESLVNHMRSAQQSRQLAPAELERARKTERDLRRLMESGPTGAAEDGASRQEETSGSGADSTSEGDDGVFDVESEDEEILSIDVSTLTPEASARLRQIDLAAESHVLASLRGAFASLFEHRPEVAAGLDDLVLEVEGGRSVAASIPGLKDELERAQAELIDALRSELEDVEASLGDVVAEVDTSELRQATRVALGILATTLPSASDVEHLRQLRALALEQSEAHVRAEEAVAVQLASQHELVRRLEDTLVTYEAHSAAEDVRRLREELEALREAQANRTLVPEVVASVRQVEERLAKEIAERATEESQRRRARLQSMRAQLLALPPTATYADRLDAVLRELDRLLEDVEGTEAASALLLDGGVATDASSVDEADVDALESMVAALRGEAAMSVRRHLDELASRAAEIGSVPFGERVQGAMTDLESGLFPDLALLQVELGRASESARSAQLGELHRLSREAQAYAAMDDGSAQALDALLRSERDQLSAGGHARRLGEAAMLLDSMAARLDERIESMPARLDVALERLAEVERLNSDEVAAARRVLQHLDSQRDSFSRVSVGLKLQLESSLTSAEELLSSLEEQFEATRLIADELVAGGLLDGVLGASWGSSAAEVESAGPGAAELVARYRETPGVVSARAYDSAGDLIAGDAPAGSAGHAALEALRTAAGVLLEAGEGDVVSLNVSSDTRNLVVASSPELSVLLEVDSAALAPVLSGRLRRDLGSE